MINILFISENDNIYHQYKNLFDDKLYKFNSCCNTTSIYDLIEIEPVDVVIIDEAITFANLSLLLKKINSKVNNVHILLLTKGNNIEQNIANLVSGFITYDCSSSLIMATVDSHAKLKQKADTLHVKNIDLANSLYRLNVLYNTSSQFAGSLDINELHNYMIEGLDKSLSFDLTCTLSFGFGDQPILIVNSLYDISEELMSALKTRALSNYKALFDCENLPYELSENIKTTKKIKNPTKKFTFDIFEYDNMFTRIDLGDKLFGCIEIFRNKHFSNDDASYFQTIVKQVSLPLKSASLYREIIKKNEELEKLEHIKSEFISIVSHELRTPLTPIKNALSILSSGRCGQMSESAIKFIDMAKRNIGNLTNIINDILDINKIEAGKMDFNYSIMNIHSVIDSVKNNFECVAKEHGIIFETQEQEKLPNIYADSQRLGQVLTNLVSNAMKFTPDGKSVTIKSELINSKDICINKHFEKEIKELNGDYILVSVVDQGIGIEEGNLVKAFDKFTQIENSLSRKVGGTGLGLPIAKQLISAHKGCIWCDSEEKVGSSFYFAIPVVTDIIEKQTVQKELVGR